jgi:hypothetical protein
MAEAGGLVREGSGGMDPDDLVRQNELMARAAQARHRERIDFSAGNLDCEYFAELEEVADLRSRRMVTEPRAASFGATFQSSTSCILHHVSTGVHARYGFRRTVLQ